ncbi:MAG TPA: hypothetical protein VIH30_10725, partial [Aquirhabdus sp.]
MSALQINPFEYFTDSDSSPLDAGFIYIGVANLDPETNPISVFYDAALTIPVSQPIRTVNGYVLNAGAPASLYVDSNYSVRVNNRNMVQIYYIPDFSKVSILTQLPSSVGSSLIGFIQSGSNAMIRTAQSKMREWVSPYDFGAVGDGTLHPVSEWYTIGAPNYRGFANLAAVQALFPFVTAGANSIDWVATYAAEAEALVRNLPLFLAGARLYIDATVNVRVNVIGGYAKVYTAGNSNFTVFKIDSQVSKVVSDIEFLKDGTTIKRGYPVTVGGESAGVKLINIKSDGYYSTVATTNTADNAISAIHEVGFTATATGGTWKIGYYLSDTNSELFWTTSLDYNANAAAVQSALDALFGGGKVTVTTHPTLPRTFTLTFGGSYAGVPVRQPIIFGAPTGYQELGGYAHVVQDGNAKWVRMLALEHCESVNAGIYGFEFNYVDGLTLTNCKATYSVFDGAKLRNNVRNVDIVHCEMCYNGVSWFADPQYGG